GVWRASSLAAVTIFVWSTRLSRRSTAAARTAWRMRTMSSDDRSDSVSSLSIGIRGLGDGFGGCAVASARLERTAKNLHALFDVESGAHAGKGEAKRHEGDGHRRSHAHHHRLRVEHSSNRRDAPEHAADERVDHLEGGDVDEDGAGARLDDAIGEILLQRHGEPVVHVDLHGDE